MVSKLEALSWLANQPEGSAAVIWAPQQIALALLNMRGKEVKSTRGLGGFVVLSITNNGRALLAKLEAGR